MECIRSCTRVCDFRIYRPGYDAYDGYDDMRKCVKVFVRQISVSFVFHNLFESILYKFVTYNIKLNFDCHCIKKISVKKGISSEFGVYKFLFFREILAHSSNAHISDYA